jgi:hypothetical protein
MDLKLFGMPKMEAKSWHLESGVAGTDPAGYGPF